MNRSPIKRRYATRGPGVLALFFSAGIAAAQPLADPRPPLAWNGTVEIAAGRAERGPWQQNESRYDYVDDPAVAIADDGRISLAWVQQRSKDVFFQRYAADAGKPLGEPVNISRSPETFSWLPRIVLAPGDAQKVYVLWQEIIFSGGSHGGDIVFARSEDGGASFFEPQNLSRSAGGDGKGRINREVWHNGSLDVAAGADGAVYAAWTEYDGALWLAVSGDGGRTFTPPRHLAGTHEEPARAPSLALGPERTLYLAWTVGEDRAADIRVARSTDGGASFSEPRIVARTSGYSDAPKLAADQKGTLHLVFAESAGGPFAPAHIRYARSADGARSFDVPREISRGSAAFPAMSVDARGHVYVLWETLPRAGQRPRGLGIAVSRDGGRSFGAPAAVPDSADPAGGGNGSYQGLLMKKLAVSPRGEIAVVNSSLKDGEQSRVWLIRGAAS